MVHAARSLFKNSKPVHKYVGLVCLLNFVLMGISGIQVGSYTEAQKQFTEFFWVPLDGVDGIYLHYGNNITQWVKEDLLKASVEP